MKVGKVVNKVIDVLDILSITILVLAILLYFLITSQKKNKQTKTVENFTDTQVPQYLRIKDIDSENKTVTIRFKKPNMTNNGNNKEVKKYIIALAGYESLEKNGDGDDAKLIYKYLKSHTVTPEEGLCDSDNLYCEYTIPIKFVNEKNVNNLYFRLSIITVYSDDTHSDTIRLLDNKGNEKTFRLLPSLKDQDNCQKICLEKSIKKDDGKNESGDNSSNKLELIKRQLGGFPDNLVIDQQTGPNSLQELTKHQLAQGILDINVHTQ
jgi:hypothetical protein